MSDLIRRQDAIDACRSVADNINSPTDQQIGAEYCLDLIKEIPYAEPEQKIGHWIDTDNYYQRWKCSECGYHTRDAEPNYCPSCGADMRMRGK